jgi:ribosome-interacting GTPase 1
MPANLTADYLSAELAYKRAQTREERISALQEMIAALPKHKGTEKMLADLRRKLSEARREPERKAGHAGPPAWLVRQEGAGQVALIGPPNSGKSQMICALTHARPVVADYPFTTRMPAPGMMMFENVSIQLVDTPAMSPEFTEQWMPQLIRAADLSVLVIDPKAPDVLGGIDFVLESAERGKFDPPALLAGNKLDVPGAEQDFAAVRELYGDRFRSIGISALHGTGLDRFARVIFESLDVVRFYSKPPGKKPDLDVPFTLHRGDTVLDAAARVHRDLAQNLKYARLFRRSHEHDGLMVERSHVIEDEDILEFHA